MNQNSANLQNGKDSVSRIYIVWIFYILSAHNSLHKLILIYIFPIKKTFDLSWSKAARHVLAREYRLRFLSLCSFFSLLVIFFSQVLIICACPKKATRASSFWHKRNLKRKRNQALEWLWSRSTKGGIKVRGCRRMQGVKVLTTVCMYKIISPYLKSLGSEEKPQFKTPFRFIKSLGWRLQQVFCLWWVAVCLTLFTWYWVFVNVISYLQKIHTFYGSMYVCECAEGHMTVSSYLVEQLDFFSFAFGDGCECRSWLTDACQKPPFSFSKTTYDGLRSFSSAGHRDHASCNWSGMESAISQLPFYFFFFSTRV